MSWHFKSDASKFAPKLMLQNGKNSQGCVKICALLQLWPSVNAIFQNLDEISRRNPEIKGFLKHWQLRKSHTFSPFRGGGLPGVNMSEQGNASFKPAKTMRLVHAAKYDVSAMILQETQIRMFHNT